MYKFDEQYILTLPVNEEKNTLTIYKRENNDLIEYNRIETNISYKKYYRRLGYPKKNIIINFC